MISYVPMFILVLNDKKLIATSFYSKLLLKIQNANSDWLIPLKLVKGIRCSVKL